MGISLSAAPMEQPSMSPSPFPIRPYTVRIGLGLLRIVGTYAQVPRIRNRRQDHDRRLVPQVRLCAKPGRRGGHCRLRHLPGLPQRNNGRRNRLGPPGRRLGGMIVNAKTKPPTKRALELARAMLAGYEDDPHTYVRIVVERRAASMIDLQKAYEQGMIARQKSER